MIAPIEAAILHTAGPEQRPVSREDAARKFEAHLVRQMVAEMFAGVFSEGVGGEKSGVASVGGDQQKDIIVNELTELLTSRGGLGLADTMLRQWNERFGDEATSESKELNPVIRK